MKWNVAVAADADNQLTRSKTATFLQMATKSKMVAAASLIIDDQQTIRIVSAPTEA
jgi:hypothetical protein